MYFPNLNSFLNVFSLVSECVCMLFFVGLFFFNYVHIYLQKYITLYALYKIELKDLKKNRILSKNRVGGSRVN